ncbi:UDP-N-acetylenolpyruvoylglucosamine reductase [Candidatus Photodesmus blepharus]|uniref:UDP-N-acetylenolpyruvoylglucosamine reductase n=1 Tax=Candidatus Photodesmus blepharonis TaxID=1179155 RepID=A0A084CMK2_9GAMM|nr:UDP-N-acetylmuramate dehydrogenase [Candidatus Photodesmus blepharus]KEY91031.1 UDP-N-acetylenolpyruvoylglucosamine reductase [Candidatus Photodesmus blepharus]
MKIYSNYNLSSRHTFSISQLCQWLIEVFSVEDLLTIYQSSRWCHLPKIVLGKGSNILFTEKFDGIVVINKLHGKSVFESETDYHLRIKSGEDWPSLVEWSVREGYFGLENLALIPGCAGSAPIQNIGAYGVELTDVCEYVDVLCLNTFKIKRLSSKECLFGYRDSVFKHQLYEKVIIVAIGLKLTKNWQAKVRHKSLNRCDPRSVTAKQIFDKVCSVRRKKLPDPRVMGNAGSFFKNPVICQEQYQELICKFANIEAYPTKGGMKISAGFLIDNCGLKGKEVGGAKVHSEQALVIVNDSNATAQDIIDLAVFIRKKVLDRYGVVLEYEVRFIGSRSEITLPVMLD